MMTIRRLAVAAVAITAFAASASTSSGEPVLVLCADRAQGLQGLLNAEATSHLNPAHVIQNRIVNAGAGNLAESTEDAGGQCVVNAVVTGSFNTRFLGSQATGAEAELEEQDFDPSGARIPGRP